MRNAYTKDILRTIRKNAKRFVAIMAITALGLTAFAGITAAVKDMYLAADRFYDEQRLFDIRVVSTLGLTDEDVEALQNVSGVETADAAYSETVHTEVDGLRQSAEMRMLSPMGLNMPYLVEGMLPQRAGEIAVTQRYLDASGKTLGDTLAIEEDLEEAEAEGAEQANPAAPEKDADADGAKDADDGLDIDVDWDTETGLEEEDETPTFLNTQYTIVGVVIDPMDIANNEGTTAFRSTAATDYTFFITPADVDTDVYTSVFLTLHGLAELDTYSDEYAARVQAVVDLIETEIMKQRQQARYDAIVAEALERIEDAEALMNENFEAADDLFDDAWADILKARQELTDGRAELTQEEQEALQQLADARAELEEGKRQLAEAEAQLANALAQLQAGQAEYDKGLAEYNDGLAQYQASRASVEALATGAASLPGLYDGMEQLLNGYAAAPDTDKPALLQQAAQAAAAITQIMDGLSAFFAAAGQDAVAGAIAAISLDTSTKLQAATASGNIADYELVRLAIAPFFQPPGSSLYLAVATAMAAAIGELENAKTELEAAGAKLAQAKTELDSGWAEYYDGVAQLEAARAELANGEAELNEREAEALQEIAKAWQDIADGAQELADGEAELQENEQEYLEKKNEAQEQLADAYAELYDMDMAQWYVQDRTSVDSYSSLDSDLGSIDAIGRVFPILFLVVAILISLTTMTRMVEEERGLIGTYKALGFSNASIGRKYILYALLASLAGGLAGSLLGFTALPKVLIYILGAIYIIPEVPLYFDAPYALVGSGLFMASIVVATALACNSELRQTPAALMRPKAPRAGSRIFLERIPAIWNRLKFSNKVTARNLFRYKRRLFMTVIGIAGCTALVLAGFAIRDSVADLLPRQYGGIYRYDLMVVADSEDEGELLRYLEQDDAIADYLSVQMKNVKIFNAAGESESVQMIVVPAGGSLEPYISTPDKGGRPAALADNGILLTQNAASLLGLSRGDTAKLQTLLLDRGDVVVDEVVENYLGNSVYISQTLYESLFGEYEANAAYAHFSDAVADQPAHAEELLDRDFVMSTVSTADMKEQFLTDFAILNYVIYILLVLAAGLAFVVLFTLSNTNISERVRELATIKVLGFYDNEVHAYVNKETLILTLLGILCGLPLGHVLSGLLLAALKMPSLTFALTIEPQSYLISAAISLAFALVVNLMTNRVLNNINMVEALKSVE